LRASWLATVSPMLFSDMCSSCGAPLMVTRALIGTRPRCFEDLAFRCEACGVGFSNSSDPETRRRIYRDPCDNVPHEVRDGLSDVLRCAVNVRNRSAKRFKFGSSRSEDALTWTVFEGLRKSGQLDAVLPPRSRTTVAGEAPAVLAWGYPVTSDAAHVAEALRAVSHDLGEKPCQPLRARRRADLVEPRSVCRGQAR
jgi:hypothetical protein